MEPTLHAHHWYIFYCTENHLSTVAINGRDWKIWYILIWYGISIFNSFTQCTESGTTNDCDLWPVLCIIQQVFCTSSNFFIRPWVKRRKLWNIFNGSSVNCFNKKGQCRNENNESIWFLQLVVVFKTNALNMSLVELTPECTMQFNGLLGTRFHFFKLIYLYFPRKTEQMKSNGVN